MFYSAKAILLQLRARFCGKLNRFQNAVRMFTSAGNFLLDLENWRIHQEEARPTINRATLWRIKWNCRERIALGTVNGNLDFLLYAGSLRGSDGCEPFILCLLAVLTAFGWIFKLLVPKKYLFARRPDKTFGAVNTDNWCIFKFWIGF